MNELMTGCGETERGVFHFKMLIVAKIIGRRWRMVEGYWQDIAETIEKKNQSKYHTVHRKSHMDWPGIEHGPVCRTKLIKSKAH